jgi:hypothetical protein
MDTRCCERSWSRCQHRATEGVCVEDLEEWQGESECRMASYFALGVLFEKTS